MGHHPFTGRSSDFWSSTVYITSSAQGMPTRSRLYRCRAYMLKQNAYVEYCNNVMGPPESYSMWNQVQRSQTVPQFKLWSMIELELLITRFVRSLRERYTSHYMYNHATNPAAGTGTYELRTLAPCPCP